VKKNLILPTTLIIFLLLFCGCTEQTTLKNNFEDVKNIAPTPILQSPEKGYFDENIEFDASKSYDIDGEILSYYWNFMDGTTKEGQIVQHIFKMENEYNAEYPIIYTITLQITDNNLTATTYLHQIKIYPKNYIFYLNQGKLVNEKPVTGKETIKSNNLLTLKNEKYLLYELDETVTISNFVCNITLFLEKNALSKINQIKIELIDDENNVLETFEEKTNLNLWTNKKIQIKKDITQEITLKSIKVSTYSLLVLNQVDILYGDEKPSSIIFELNY